MLVWKNTSPTSFLPVHYFTSSPLIVSRFFISISWRVDIIFDRFQHGTPTEHSLNTTSSIWMILIPVFFLETLDFILNHHRNLVSSILHLEINWSIFKFQSYLNKFSYVFGMKRWKSGYLGWSLRTKDQLRMATGPIFICFSIHYSIHENGKRNTAVLPLNFKELMHNQENAKGAISTAKNQAYCY